VIADIAWQRRDRRTDLAAAALFSLSVALCMRAGYVAGCIAAALGLILMLAHRDRRIERTGGGIQLVDEWWLLGVHRTSRQVVQPGRVTLTVPETGWFRSRRTILSVEGMAGSVIVEKWRQPSDRVYALALAGGLARWFNVQLSGTLAPFDGWPDGPSRWASLRASLGESASDNPSAWASERPYRRLGRRPFWQLALHALAGVEGVALMAVSALAPRAHGIDRLALGAALAIGVLLLAEGLRGALPGAIVTEVGPNGLHIERRSLRRELVLHLPFASVTWLGTPPVQGVRRALRIGSGEAFVDLTGRILGLGSADFSEVCAVYRGALARWLDRELGRNGAAPRRDDHTPAPPAGPVFLDDPRLAPGSPVPVLAQAFPGLAILSGPAFLVTAFLLAQIFAHGVGLVPANVRFVFPDVLPFLALKAATTVLGAGAAAAICALALYLFWSAPQVPGQILLALPMIALSLLPVFLGGLYGPQAIDCLDICGGVAQPARLPLTVYAGAMQYGPYSYVAPGSKRPDERDGWFSTVGAETERLDVEGLLGGRYLVAARAYHLTCDRWRARLPDALEHEVVE
jgi:hypothetical protein